MKQTAIRVLALAAAVLVVILIHRRVEFEAAEAERLVTEAAEQGHGALADERRSLSVLRIGDGAALGRVTENTELGGIDLTVTAADGTETTYTFTDVPADAWFVNAVNYAVSAGLMTGVEGQSLFRPEYGVQREMFASVLYRFVGGEPVEADNRFEDISEGAWYRDAVLWATENGCLTPLESGRFGVGEFITCEQALVGLYRIAGEPETDGLLTDYPYAAKVSEYGHNAIDWAWKNELITEDECVWYPPQAISRAQVALLLMRFSEKIS